MLKSGEVIDDMMLTLLEEQNSASLYYNNAITVVRHLKQCTKIISKQIPAYFRKDTQTHPLSIHFDSLVSNQVQHSNPSHRMCAHLVGECG